jgi:peptide/nickel transport system ATP-binding protein
VSFSLREGRPQDRRRVGLRQVDLVRYVLAARPHRRRILFRARTSPASHGARCAPAAQHDDGLRDPYASLNARKRVGFIIGGPELHGIGTPAERKRRVRSCSGRRPEPRAPQPLPHEFSGGQRQRSASRVRWPSARS